MDERTSGFLQRRRLHILLIIFLGLLVYSNTFDAPFQFDDLLFVDYRSTETGIAKAVSGLQADKEDSDVISLSAKTLMGPWTSRPLLYITFVINHYIGGFNTWSYHAVNITLHILNGVLLYFLVIMTGRNLGHKEIDTAPVALLSSLIFVLHPIQTEAVTSVINRSMLMAMTFYLAGLMLFLKTITSKGREKNNYTVGLLFAVILGAASREDFATFPIMLVLYDIFFVSRFRLREVGGHLKEYAAVLPGIALMGYLALTNTYDRSADFTNFELPLNLRIPPIQYALTQLNIHWTYIRLLLLPVNQSLIYKYPVSKTLFDITTIFSFLGYAGLWTSGLLFAKKRPAVSFGILWFLIALLPVSFVIALMGLRLGDPIFEHRLYLPSVGLIVLAALAILHFIYKRRILVPALITICIALGSATYARNEIWTNTGSLWKDTVTKYPNSPRAHNNLATYFYDERFLNKAIEHMRIALEYWPENPHFHANLGSIYLKKGNVDKSIEHLETAVKLAPADLFARQRLGAVYMANEQYEEALKHFLESSRLAPWDITGLNNAARACYALGRKEEAIKHYILSLWIDRKQVRVLHNISVLYMETGQTERAIEHLEALVSFVPGHVPARLALGKLYMEKKQPLKAIYHLREALKFNPDSPNVHRALAGVYEEVGNVQSANEHLKRAEALEKTSLSNSGAIW